MIELPPRLAVVFQGCRQCGRQATGVGARGGRVGIQAQNRRPSKDFATPFATPKHLAAKPALQKPLIPAIVRGPDGERTGVNTYQGAVANKALELLGRNIGMFKDAVPVQVNINLPGDESDFADRLRARCKLRSDGKTQLH